MNSVINTKLNPNHYVYTRKSQLVVFPQPCIPGRLTTFIYQVDEPIQNVAIQLNNKEYKMTKKVLKGTVTSAKNNKTIVVEVTRKFKHPFYEKVIKRSKKYHAHDEKNKFKEGEQVSIIECKPFSKKKTWQVIE